MKSICRKFYYKIISLPDKLLLRLNPAGYISRRYKKLFNKKINLNNPSTFSEKLQWLKLNDHNEKIILYADKIAVREHVKSVIGEKYLIPMINCWEKVEDIDLEQLPEAFVIKPNNSSGEVIICKNKKDIDIKSFYKTLKRWSKDNLTKRTGEWFYEKIPFGIICEKLLADDISDYKLYFADGEFLCTQVISGRSSNNKRFQYYDENWNLLNIVRHNMPDPGEPVEKPLKYDEMLTISKKLAEDFNFMRVDLYYVDNEIYFGELSFYPNNGFIRYKTDEMDEFFSSKIKLDR